MSFQFDNNKQKVEEACNKRARRSERCAKPETEIKSCKNDEKWKKLKHKSCEDF